MSLRRTRTTASRHTRPNAEIDSREATEEDHAEALREARAADAADYVRRYARFSREVRGLDLADGIASVLFPAAAWVFGLLLLGQMLGRWVELTGGGHPLGMRGGAFFFLFGLVAATAGACRLAARERQTRRGARPQRVREIAARHGVDPDRPRIARSRPTGGE